MIGIFPFADPQLPFSLSVKPFSQTPFSLSLTPPSADLPGKSLFSTLPTFPPLFSAPAAFPSTLHELGDTILLRSSSEAGPVGVWNDVPEFVVVQILASVARATGFMFVHLLT